MTEGCLYVFRCKENNLLDQELKAYVPASGNRPNPEPDTQLSVGFTVGCFAAMNSTCQGIKKIALMSSPMSSIFFLHIALLRVTVRGT